MNPTHQILQRRTYGKQFLTPTTVLGNSRASLCVVYRPWCKLMRRRVQDYVSRKIRKSLICVTL